MPELKTSAGCIRLQEAGSGTSAVEDLVERFGGDESLTPLEHVLVAGGMMCDTLFRGMFILSGLISVIASQRAFPDPPPLAHQETPLVCGI